MRPFKHAFCGLPCSCSKHPAGQYWSISLTTPPLPQTPPRPWSARSASCPLRRIWSHTDLLRAALQREIGQLRTWYDLAVTRRGRTTVGVSRLTPEEMGTFIGAFLDGQAPPNPRADVPLAALFRYAVEDLKAYYCEALAAQPGHSTVDSTTLADWFWRETTAGRVLFAVHEVCKQSAVPGMQAVAAGLLIPRARSAESPFAKA